MPKPIDRLPPLELLESFEAAARHLSFTRAASERFLTQSAISRQVQALEEAVGAPLFTRAHRKLELTEQGRILWAACSTALQDIRQAVGAIRPPATRDVVSVTATLGFTSLWLLPRLASFTEAHPEVDLRIQAGMHKLDLGESGMDIAIRYVPSSSKVGRKLFDETMEPMCTKAVASAKNRRLKSADDLRNHTLLEVTHHSDAGVHSEWDDWLNGAGVPALQPKALLSFSSYGDAVMAALAGQGVVLGREPLVEEALARGDLVAPFNAPALTGWAYYLVMQASSRKRPAVQAFEAWVLQEARVASQG